MNIFNDSDSETEPLGTDLVPPAPILEARITSTTFDNLLSTPLKLHEDLARGCGGQIWPAGECLAKYVLRRWGSEEGRKEVQGRRIVELGAGGGIVGLAVASALKDIPNPPEIWITDQEPMLDLMQRNTALNDLPVKVCIYDWGTTIPSEILSSAASTTSSSSGTLPSSSPRPPVDIILAADCVYYEPAFPLLEATLLDLLEGKDAVCYFCFKKRRKADIRFLKKVVKKLDVREVEVEEGAWSESERERWRREGVGLWVMKGKVGRK